MKVLVPLIAILFVSGCRQQTAIRVVVQRPSPLLDIAAKEIASRLQEKAYKVEITRGRDASAGLMDSIVLSIDGTNSDSRAEGFDIIPIHAGQFVLLRVTAKDARGALWGAMEAADQILSTDKLQDAR